MLLILIVTCERGASWWFTALRPLCYEIFYLPIEIEPLALDPG